VNQILSRLKLKNLAEISVSPVVLMVMIWAWQFSAHVFFETGLNKPSILVWAIVFVGIVAFVFGAILAYVSLPRKTVFQSTYSSWIAAGPFLIKISLPLAVFSAGALILRIDDQGFGLFLNIKVALLEESVSGNKSNLYFAYAIIFNALCVLYYCNTINFMAHKRTLWIVALTAILCLFSGSRGLLIMFLIAMFPAYIFHGKDQGPKILTLPIFMVALTLAFFFLYPIFFQSYEFGSDGSESLLDYMYTYLFSGISAFSYFVDNGTPSYDCILLIPRVITFIIDFIFSTNFYGQCPALFAEVDGPLTANVYSIFFQPMHDFGLLGVVFYLFTIGYVSMLAYLRGFFYGSVSWRFMYGIFFYSIFMSFFEDQFARGFIYYFFAMSVLSFVWIINVLDRRCQSHN